MDKCVVDFTAGNEFTGIKTEDEQKGILSAWYTDIEKEFHQDRTKEEKAFLLMQNSVKTKHTTNSLFKSPECTIPIGITSEMGVSILVQSKEDASQWMAQKKRYEIEQMTTYFRTLIGRAKTRKHIKEIQRELSILVGVDDFFKENLLCLSLELKNAQIDETEEKYTNIRGTPVEQNSEKEICYSKHVTEKKPQKDIQLDDSITSHYTVRVLTCPVPLSGTSSKVSHKRCIWKADPNVVLLCDSGTFPLVKIAAGDNLLVCRIYKGKLHFGIFKIGSFKEVYTTILDISRSVVDCDYDQQNDRVVIAFDMFMLVFNLKKDQQILNMFNMAYKDDDSIRVLSCVYAGYNEIIFGTTRGEVITFNADYKPTKFEPMPSQCHVLSIFRKGSNLYAQNIMNVANLETGDESYFSRGVEIAKRGGMFCGDRVVGAQSCGTLLVTINKYGILQVQPNRECPDPADPTKYLPSAIYSKREYVSEKNGIFINYNGIHMDRKNIYCLFPNGKIQCVWLTK